MTAALRHRGPDGEGTLRGRPAQASLEHCRLAIIDPGNREADQPLADASGRWTIAYNGELFNYRELRQSLIKRGVQFRFFHQVKALELSPDRTSIACVRIGRQVTLKNGAPYDPLVPVLGLGCWPSEPRWTEIDPVQAPEKPAVPAAVGVGPLQHRSADGVEVIACLLGIVQDHAVDRQRA